MTLKHKHIFSQVQTAWSEERKALHQHHSGRVQNSTQAKGMAVIFTSLAGTECSLMYQICSPYHAICY